VTSEAVPPRTLGISIALAGSAILFGILPLLQLAYIAWLTQYVAVDPEGGMAGFRVSGVDPVPVAGQIIASVGFLLMTAQAWRGRPAWMRQVYSLAVFLFSIVLIGSGLRQMAASSPLGEGITSMDDFWRNAQFLQVAGVAVLGVYVVWYLNRWPARAFFRGSYPNEWYRSQRLWEQDNRAEYQGAESAGQQEPDT
jgi:hypothetical protein